MKIMRFYRISLAIVFIFCFSACRIMDYPGDERASIFNRFVKPKFQTNYYIYPDQFTPKEVETIKNGFKNWEPILQKLSGTDIHFKFVGFKAVPIDLNDDIHVVVRIDQAEGCLACAGIKWSGNEENTSPLLGADIHINSDYNFHTSDQWHLEGWREYLFSYCLEAVVTHEVGHLLGLNHSKNENDVMYPSNTASCLRIPSSGDEKALEDLYLKKLINYSFE